MKWKAFCNLTSLAIGNWQTITSPSLEQINSMTNPWYYCPKTYEHILETNRYNGSKGSLELEMISDHIRKYSCYNHSYSYMKYNPIDCQLRTIRNSLHKIDYVLYHTIETEGVEGAEGAEGEATVKKANNLDPESGLSHSHHYLHIHTHTHANSHAHTKSHSHVSSSATASTTRRLSVEQAVSSSDTSNNKPTTPLIKNRFVYIGDSLTAQMFIAGSCLIEQMGYQHDLYTSYIPELWLRPDIPCDPSCIDNPALYSQHKVMFNPCAGCYKGKKRPFEIYSKHPRFWYQRIPNDTLAVVFGNGAWYNGYKGVIDSNKVYEETMILIKPFIKTLIEARNISVFWISLPPTANDGKAEYEWMNFRLKDSIVKQHLEPIGVQFIDEMLFLNDRKLKDPKMNPDGFHWCNPGINSAPSFLNQIIFHLMASKLFATRVFPGS